MTTSSITEYRAYGAVILDRLSGVSVPAALKPHVVSFKKAHADYETAAALVDKAREARDSALEAVGEADDVFDSGVLDLANKLVGAGIGTRQNPFAGLSKHSPGRLTELPYAEEPKAIRVLGDALAKKKPPADVTKALNKCLKDATAIETALGKLTKPQAAFAKALGARDALLPGWTKALRTLKKHAAATWDEDIATYKAVFAPPDAVQAPRKKRAKKKAEAEKQLGATGPNGVTPAEP